MNPTGGASRLYETMTTQALCELELPPLAERHVVILWRLASMLPDALQVLDAWGYVAAAELVWCKLRPCQTCAATGRVEAWTFAGEDAVLVPGADRPCPDCGGRGGTPHLGLGHYTRGAHEVAIIARPKRGRAPERLNLSVPSVFEAPMLVDVHGLVGERGCVVHSAKPDTFFKIVEQLYPGPYLEGFSRRTRPGWRSVWSDQDGRLDEVARVMREVWPREVREERLAKGRRKLARGRS